MTDEKPSTNDRLSAQAEHGAGKYFSSGQEITTKLMFAVIPLAILGAFIMPSFKKALKTGKAFDGTFKLAKVDAATLY